LTANEKIRTEDVVEILDNKILTTRAHTALGVIARENYDSVLGKIAGQVLSPAEKEAFDNTLSAPSASNPVVLKEDLQTYIPLADLGDVKDTVATFSALPLSGNTTGDLRAVIADNIIYRWNGTGWDIFIHTGTLDHTELTNQNGDPNFQHLTLAEKTTLLTQTHTHSNLPILEQILSSGSGQIITAAERNRLPSVGEKEALAGTSGVPSTTNRYVTNQDPRLSTTRNPYVTIGPPGSLASFSGVDFRPFEDALVAIDIGSANSVKAIEVLPGTYTVGGVVLKWDVQNSALLFEAFVPGTVVLSFQTFTAGVQALLPGTGPVTIRGFTFELNDLGTSGILSQRANTLIEDCVFKPGPTTSVDQIGVILEGANSVVRRCRFENELEKGVEIRAANCRVEDCIFNLSNPQKFGVYVAAGGNNAIIDHNMFLRGRIKILDSTVLFTQVSNNYYNIASTALNPTISVGTPAVASIVNFLTNLDLVTLDSTGNLPTGLVKGRRYYVRNRTPTQFNLSLLPSGPLAATTGAGSGVHTVQVVEFVKDDGSSSRILENQPEDYNQPFIGKTRTIGPEGTYADYRGSSQVPFWKAVDDPTVKEIEILPGVYTFTESVTLPAGFKVRGVTQNSSTDVVSIIGPSGLPPFILSTDTTVENITFQNTAAAALQATSATNIRIDRCTFNSISDFAVKLTSCTDYQLRFCSFQGVSGLSTTTSTRGKILNNKFNCTTANLTMVGVCQNDHIKDNYFLSTVAPALVGQRLIVEGNHFLGNLPTKINTTLSVWQSNYPAPQANNVEGVDTIELSLDGFLEPLSGPVAKSSIVSCGSVSFGDSLTGSAVTLPIKLPARLNTVLGFTVQLYWSSTVLSNSVMWEVTPVFRDAVAGTLGSSSSQQQLSARSAVSANAETSQSFTFTTLAYGGTATPTHVSFIVSRIGAHPSDNLAGVAHLLDVKIVLPRD